MVLVNIKISIYRLSCHYIRCSLNPGNGKMLKLLQTCSLLFRIYILIDSTALSMNSNFCQKKWRLWRRWHCLCVSCADANGFFMSNFVLNIKTWKHVNDSFSSLSLWRPTLFVPHRIASYQPTNQSLSQPCLWRQIFCLHRSNPFPLGSKQCWPPTGIKGEILKYDHTIPAGWFAKCFNTDVFNKTNFLEVLAD